MSAALEPMITDDPYQFDTDQHNVPLFTRKNMDLIHALLRYDSAYSAAFDTEDDDSYAGWLHRHGVPTKFDGVERIINQIPAQHGFHDLNLEIAARLKMTEDVQDALPGAVASFGQVHLS